MQRGNFLTAIITLKNFEFGFDGECNCATNSTQIVNRIAAISDSVDPLINLNSRSILDTFCMKNNLLNTTVLATANPTSNICRESIASFFSPLKSNLTIQITRVNFAQFSIVLMNPNVTINSTCNSLLNQRIHLVLS